MRKLVLFAPALLLLLTALYAQRPQEVPSWAPKPDNLPKYTAPHKPHTKLSDVKAKHKSEKAWREVVIDDDHLHTEYIMAPPRRKSRPRLPSRYAHLVGGSRRPDQV